ncbi:putative tRNA ligase [Lyophyllum shimeji]|uniref:tRNA ligase n=1 Tax=Lyophyllum shimeji TaxID=47721 RepID=A0A9P3PN27_LYOSH|nr:putative tRNA ligase [Lyophyllum shimeji]
MLLAEYLPQFGSILRDQYQMKKPSYVQMTLNSERTRLQLVHRIHYKVPAQVLLPQDSVSPEPKHPKVHIWTITRTPRSWHQPSQTTIHGSSNAYPSITVRSWRMSEFKYYEVPSPFPTLARGIFTVELPPDAESKGAGAPGQKYRIVARGYDKFFNIGEVPWNTWPALEAHTAPPYTLSQKSNGCIIFIAALTSSKLLITSKHSLGPVEGSPVSHAQAGEGWLRKHLQKVGRTEEQLAARLWEKNWTAIAELCDDSFEEHVLAYPPEKTGLHLHGINESTKAFKTLPQPDVDAFADEWGFIKTPSLVLNSIADVRSFTQKVGEERHWNGEPTEGFVVRTHVVEPPAGKDSTQSPYAPGSTFFFKVKFDEPYMMYRDWREVTKKLLGAATPSAASLPKQKMRRPETRVYVRWVIDEIKRDRQQFEEYTKGKGIIASRERFLEYLQTDEGKGELARARKAGEDIVGGVENTGSSAEFKKTIIYPVAIPGCGKTAVAVALKHIFGFAHTQSDDVTVKKSAPVFIKNVTGLLKNHDVVIADKNNHLAQHRKQLRDVARTIGTPTRLLALNWGLGGTPQATVHRVCGDRVKLRGPHHQTLRPDESAAHEDVIWMFLRTREELTESEANAVVEMDVEESLEGMVRRAVDGVVRVLGPAVEKPSEEKIKDALEAVGAYRPTVVKKSEEVKKPKEGAGARYFGMLAEVDLEEVLGTRLGAVMNAPGDEGEAAKFWGEVRAAGRVTKRPHVTIVHRNSLPDEQGLWEMCAGLQTLERQPLFSGRLGHLVWNQRVMAVTVDDLDVVDEEGSEDVKEGVKKGKEFLAALPEDVKRRLHITVATKETSILAVEAKGLVEAWRRGEDASKEVKSIKLDGAVIKGRIKGLNS